MPVQRRTFGGWQGERRGRNLLKALPRTQPAYQRVEAQIENYKDGFCPHQRQLKCVGGRAGAAGGKEHKTHRRSATDAFTFEQ